MLEGPSWSTGSFRVNSSTVLQVKLSQIQWLIRFRAWPITLFGMGECALAGIKWLSPKKRGGNGVRDFFSTYTTTPVKMAEKCWKKDKSILSNWVKVRYIRERGLEDIYCRPNLDSKMWKENFSNKRTIHFCISCLGNYVITQQSSLPHAETIRPKGIVQTENIRIWSRMPPKFSVLLWRIKSKTHL